MNWIFRLMVTLAALLSPISGLPQDGSTSKMDNLDPKPSDTLREVVARQLLVRFEDALTDQEIDVINRQLGTTVVMRMFGGKLLLVEVSPGEVLKDVLRAYEATPGVRYAEPNQIMQLQGEHRSAPPDDPTSEPTDADISGKPE